LTPDAGATLLNRFPVGHGDQRRFLVTESSMGDPTPLAGLAPAAQRRKLVRSRLLTSGKTQASPVIGAEIPCIAFWKRCGSERNDESQAC
jgi:hypothetical protein